MLGRSPGISQRELATRLGTTPSRIVPLLDSLEQRALVERSRSERDRRNYELSLTETGQALLAPLRTIAEAHQRAVLAALTRRRAGATRRTRWRSCPRAAGCLRMRIPGTRGRPRR